MNSNQKEIISNIKSTLEYHRDIGLDHYPVSEELKEFFSKSSLCIDDDAIVEELSGEDKKNSLLVIDDQISKCEHCALGAKKLRAVSGKGNEKAKLLFVGDWLKTDDDAVFGVAEDKMLGMMTKAIKLSEEDVFITNILKCAVGSSEQPVAANIDICIEFLHKQIMAIKPKIICAMGPIAARVVLDKSAPISNLRGRFHRYKDKNNNEILVMPTYHPSFLLKNPEMKKATWLDLQAIEKMLATDFLKISR